MLMQERFKSEQNKSEVRFFGGTLLAFTFAVADCAKFAPRKILIEKEADV
jgi:hypothetical protein